MLLNVNSYSINRHDNYINPRKNEIKDNKLFNAQFEQTHKNNFFNCYYKIPLKIGFKGWKPEPANEVPIKQIVSLIKKDDVKKICITGHVSPDEDCISSSIAMAALINQTTGKQVDIFMFDRFPKNLSYLVENDKNKIVYGNNYNIFVGGNKNIRIINAADKFVPDEIPAPRTPLDEKFGKYDLAIAVDCSSINMINENFKDEIFYKADNTVKIDHHPIPEKPVHEPNYADINLTDPKNCCSASELIMQFVKPMGIKDPKKLSSVSRDNIFAGMLSDSNNLEFGPNHAFTYNDAAKLVKAGTDSQVLMEKRRKISSKSIFMAKAYALNNIKYTEDNKIAYFVEDDNMQDIRELAKKEHCLKEMSSAIQSAMGEVKNLNDVELTVKVSPKSEKDENNCIKLDANGKPIVEFYIFSLRSKNMKLTDFAAKYGGGGHPNASGFTYKIKENETFPEILDKFLNIFKEEMKNQNFYE